MTLPIGTRIGAYEILASLGAGGMGEVYRARDSKLKREVAIKVLPAEVANDRDRLARFQREAEVLASLNHPNIAHIYGLEEGQVGQVGPVRHVGRITPYLVLELVEGEDLAQRLARGPIPIDEALPMVTQIADALEAAHEADIIHRDLKPANIKVRDDGSVKVLDFGLAKALDTSGTSANADNSPTITSPAMTAAGIILGTAAYMSPEQAKGKAVDRRADVWAFGCVLYEILTGRRAFEGDGISDTLAAVLRGDPDWTHLPGTLSPAVRDLLKNCLNKNLRTRVGDMAVVRYVLTGQSTSAKQDSPVRQVSMSQRLAMPVAAAILAGSATAGLFVFGNSRNAPAAGVVTRFQIHQPPGEEFASAAANDGPVAVTRDGRRLTYTTNYGAQRRHLWVRELSSLESSLMKNGEDASWPFWSPDGREVAFFADGRVKTVDIGTGSVRTICEIPGRGGGRGGVWTLSNEILFAQGLQGGPIFGVSASGGVPKPVTVLQDASEWRHGFPVLLPGERHFLYVADVDRSTQRLLYVTSIDGRHATLVTRTEGNVAFADGHILFGASGGRLVRQRFNPETLAIEGDPAIVVDDFARSSSTGIHSHFSVSENGVLAYQPISLLGTKLVAFDRNGRELNVIAAEGAAYANPSIAPNGQLVAADRFERRTGQNKIWLFDLVRGASRPLNPDLARDTDPIWFGDSSALVFGATTADSWALYRKALDSAGGAQLLKTFDAVLTYPSDVSRDNRLILFKQNRGGRGFRLGAIAEPGWEEQEIDNDTCTNNPGNDPCGRAVLSPDDRWLAYESLESGRPEIYLRRIASGDSRRDVKTLISVNGGRDPRWRADGRELFYQFDKTLFAVAVQLEPTLSIGTPKRLFRLDQWMAGRPAPTPQGRDYDVWPDGQRFILNIVDQSAPQSPMSVVLNWPSLIPVVR